MRREVEETIRQFYDDSVYINPLQSHDKWRDKKNLVERKRTYIPPLIEEIRDRISDMTQLHYDEFWMCKNAECAQVYWRGPHWEKMEETLKDCNEMIKLENEKQNNKKE